MIKGIMNYNGMVEYYSELDQVNIRSADWNIKSKKGLDWYG